MQGTKPRSVAAGLHIPPVPTRPVRTRRYAGRSPSRSEPELHRPLVMPSAERFESGREDCEEAEMHLRLLRPLCSNPSSSHHPVLSYPLVKIELRRKSNEESTYQLQPQVVVYGDLDILFGAKITFGGLDGGVSQEELDLLQIPAILPTQFGTSPTQVVGAEVFDTDLLG
jgi:hypothetical protein